MALTVDELDIVIRGKFDEVERNLNKLQREAARNLTAIERQSDRLEKSMASNSTEISSSLKRMAGAFGTYLGATKIMALADSYTRYTNQLKVAGSEGEKLVQVQDGLFTVAQRYGVELESLGTLYSRSAQVSKELGASQEDLLRFTTGVAAALKVQGGSAASAQGALLQLSQALGSGTVRAEEFNSINEGALPILKAVASNLDAAGGSVAKLKNLVNDGKVSSDAFFRAFLKGSADLEKQAASANLTLASSFTVLNNALGKYIGETDQSLSATERISQGIIGLSNNLDIVIPALAIVSVALGARYVTSALAARAATVGVTTAMGTMTLAARSAGGALLGAFGGPIGLAVTALSVAIGVAATRANDLDDAGREAQATLNALKREAKSTGSGTSVLGNALKIASDEMKTAADRAAELIQQLYGVRGAALLAARALASTKVKDAEGQLSRAQNDDGLSPFARWMGVKPGTSRRYRGEVARAEARAAAAREELRLADEALERAKVEQAALAKGGTAKPSAPAGDPKKKPKGATGPSADEIEARFNDDLARIYMERLQAELGLATNAEDRLKLTGDLLDAEYKQRAADIEAEKAYSAARKKALLDELGRLYGRDANGDVRTDSPLQKGASREFDKQSAEEARIRADDRARYSSSLARPGRKP